MPVTLKQCLLQPILHNHPPIVINTKQTIVGRSPVTNIVDENCSRQQVCLEANLKHGYVLVKTIGMNPSVLRGRLMEHNVGYKAVEGDIIELLPGIHKYVLKFVYETASTNEADDSPETSKTPEEGSSSGKRARDGEATAGDSTSKRSKVVLRPETDNWTRPEFDPKGVCDGDTDRLGDVPLLSPAGARLTSVGQEVIVMVGAPGSGKSHFVRHQLAPKGYKIVNRDTLGSWQRCTVQLETYLRQGKSVAIDSLNQDEDSRKWYLVVAARANVSVRCFVMGAGYKYARHNNEFREFAATDHRHSIISELAFNLYKFQYKEPSLSEGFTEIVRVMHSSAQVSKSKEELFWLYLLEKI